MPEPSSRKATRFLILSAGKYSEAFAPKNVPKTKPGDNRATISHRIIPDHWFPTVANTAIGIWMACDRPITASNGIDKKVNMGTKTSGPPVPLSTDRHAVKKPTNNKLIFDGVDWSWRRLNCRLVICLYEAKIRTVAMKNMRKSAFTLESVCVPTNAPGTAPTDN